MAMMCSRCGPVSTSFCPTCGGTPVLAPGSVLREYTVDGLLAPGGMGTAVYGAADQYGGPQGGHGETMEIWANQAWRPARLLATVNGRDLVEYSMPGGTTALRIQNTSGTCRAVPYSRVPADLLAEMVWQDNNWKARPQQGRMNVPPPSDALRRTPHGLVWANWILEHDLRHRHLREVAEHLRRAEKLVEGQLRICRGIVQRAHEEALEAGAMTVQTAQEVLQREIRIRDRQEFTWGRTCEERVKAEKDLARLDACRPWINMHINEQQT